VQVSSTIIPANPGFEFVEYGSSEGFAIIAWQIIQQGGNVTAVIPITAHGPEHDNQQGCVKLRGRIE